MLENNMINGRDRYTEETIEPIKIGVCSKCNVDIYDSEYYIEDVLEDKLYCDFICYGNYKVKTGEIIERT